MKSLFKDLFNLAFPSLCIACRIYEPFQKHRFCLACLNSLPFISSSKDAQAALEGKDVFPRSIDYYHSLFYYSKEGKVAEMIHRLKYQGQYKIGRYLGSLLGQKIAEDKRWQDYVIVPVPIHFKRYKIRGFNQAEEIAKGISSIINVPYIGNYLLRTSHETSQTGKDKKERLVALSSSFVRNEKYAEVKKILLVDDVVTTGSTINACVDELIKNPVDDISVLSLGISI